MAHRRLTYRFVHIAILVSASPSLHASDYDYGADTLAFLLHNSECVVSVTDTAPIDVEEFDLITTATYEVGQHLVGDCDFEAVQIVLPFEVRPRLVRDAILFLGSQISSDKALRADCVDRCKSARELTSGPYGIVPYTSQRRDEVFNYLSLQVDGAELVWANTIIDSASQDAFLQNSAIYVAAERDSSLVRNDTRRFFESVFESSTVSADVKLFGISAISLNNTQVSAGILLGVAEDSEIDNSVRIGAYEELRNLRRADASLPMDIPNMREMTKEVFLLKRSQPQWNDVTSRMRGEANSPIADGKFEAMRSDTSQEDDIAILREVIEDTDVSTGIRTQAVTSYVEYLERAAPEYRQTLIIMRDSYELEARIHEANVTIGDMQAVENNE